MIIFKISNQQRLTLTIGNSARGSIDGNLYSLMRNISETQIQSNRSVIGVDNLQFYSRQLKVLEIQALINDDYSPKRYFFYNETEHL
jgi:thymidine kinase